MSSIKLKRSAVSGRVPTTTSLDLGEIAINTYDGKLFIKKDDGSQSIIDMGSYTNLSDKPDPTVTISLTGDLSGTGSHTFTDLADGTISLVTELTNTGVTIGTYGSATAVGQFTVDEDGRITSASSVNIEPISSLAFDTSTGVITLTDTAANAFSVDLGIGTSDSPQFNDVTVVDATVTGNLTVQGTTTTVNQTTLTVNDSKIFLADGNTGDAIDVGIVFNYNDGTSDQSAMILRDATDEKIKFVNTYDQNVTSTVDFSHSSISYSTIVADTLEANVDWDYITNRPDPNVEVVLTGTVVGSANATLTDLANGSISVPTSIPTTTNLTLNNLVVSGDLTVQGTTTEQTVVTLTSESPIFILNSDAVSEPDIGMVGAYNTGGANTYSGIFRDGSDDKWKVFDGYTVAVTDSSTIDITDSSFSLGTLVADTFEGNLDFSYIQNKPDPNVEVVLTGDVTGSANTTLTDLANGSISVATTLGDYLDIVRVANTEWIDFQTTAGIPAHQEGRLFYDDSIKALSYYNEDADLIQSLGLEEMQRVYNNTGVAIPKGSAVYFSGAFTSGTVSVPTVALAIANDMVKFNAQGIMAEEIAIGGYGYIQVSGIVKGIDTSALTVGQNFFVSPDTEGAFQTMPPTYPNFPQCLGLVLTQDANDGVVSLNQQNHSIKSFRVVTDTHIGGDLILGGNLTVLGSQTIASTDTIAINNPFTYVNGGDTIGILNTSFSGTGLDDASLTGKFTGPVQTTYYVRIDGVGTGTGGVDTFEWSTDNFATTVATGVDIDGLDQLIHSTDNIAIKFESTTGHTLNDTWTGTAGPSNVDTGFITNRNTGQSAPGFTYMGLYFDVSQGKWVLFDEYDTEPSGAVDTSDASFSYASLKLENVDTYDIDVTGYIDFTAQISEPSHQAGRVFYSNEYKALTVYNDISDSALQVGHEEWIRVYNNTGSTILNGTPVYDTGAFGEMITIAPADADDETRARVLGIVTHDIANSSEGVVTTRGLLSGIDTSSLTAGKAIHLAPDGSLQEAAPTYPYYPVDLGWCVVSDATDGYIYVTIQSHTFEQFRVTGNQHIDGDMTVEGNLTVSGSTSVISTSQLAVDQSFIYLNEGDSIGQSGTTYTGSTLDDAYFTGHLTTGGPSVVPGSVGLGFIVEIDGVGTGTGGVDTFRWGFSHINQPNVLNTNLGSGGWLNSSIDIAVGNNPLTGYIPTGIEIYFNSTTGHTSGDRWYGTAFQTNVDTGWVTNRQDPSSFAFTHMGIFFDASDEKFKFFEAHDPAITSTVNTSHSSFSLGTVVADTFEGALTGDVTGNVSGNAGNADTVDNYHATDLFRDDADFTTTAQDFKLGSGAGSNTVLFDLLGTNINEIRATGHINISAGTNKLTRLLKNGVYSKLVTENDTEWFEDTANSILEASTYITKVHDDSANTITFSHDATSRTDTTGSATSLGFGDAFTVVTGTSSNATGHLTAIETTEFTVPSESDTLQTVITRGNTSDTDILFSDNKILGRNTSDGSDTGHIAVVGGGSESTNRGAIARLYGNEHTIFPGRLSLSSGNVGTGIISLAAGGTTNTYITSNGLGLGTQTPSTKLHIREDIPDASSVVYPLIIDATDPSNSIDQIAGNGVGLKLQIAGNSSSVYGNSGGGIAIEAIRENATDSDLKSSMVLKTHNNTSYVTNVTLTSNGRTIFHNDLRKSGNFTLDADDDTSTSSATVFTLFAIATYGAAKVIVTVKDGVNRQVSELLITHDGTTAVATEYGVLSTGSLLANFNVAINSSNVELTATSLGSTSGVVYNIVKTLID
tara:strand:+ start:10224 stop:15575 length:5352 start_codon:yes stop_codon:yes gene_type:complete